MEYYFGNGGFKISDEPLSSSTAITASFNYAVTKVWYEREFDEYETLDGKNHIGVRKWFRGYCDAVLINSEEDEGEELAIIASLISNNDYLYVYPRYNNSQDSNLEMYSTFNSDWDPNELVGTACKSAQQITLQFRESEIRNEIPIVLHYPVGETFRILTGEDPETLEDVFIDGDGNTLVWL